MLDACGRKQYVLLHPRQVQFRQACLIDEDIIKLNPPKALYYSNTYPDIGPCWLSVSPLTTCLPPLPCTTTPPPSSTGIYPPPPSLQSQHPSPLPSSPPPPSPSSLATLPPLPVPRPRSLNPPPHPHLPPPKTPPPHLPFNPFLMIFKLTMTSMSASPRNSSSW